MMITIPPSQFGKKHPTDPKSQLALGAHGFLFGQAPEQKAARTISIVAASVFIGGPFVSRISTATRPARNIMTWIRHPIAKHLATKSNYRSVQLGAQAYLAGMKAIRYASYGAAVYSPFETYRYMKEGDYKRAALQWYGPPGTVYVYNELTMEPVNSQARMAELKQLSKPGKVDQSSTKKTKKSTMTAKQRRRLNRMGLRYCPIHRRYDRCHNKK